MTETDATEQMAIMLKAGHAAKWSFLSQLASRAVAPIMLVVLARLLTPEDYGVMAIGTMVLSFVQLFSDVGLGKAVIQRPYHGEELDRACCVAFWLNVIIGFVVMVALFSMSGGVSRLLQEPRAKSVIEVMALQVLVGSVTSVQDALLQRDLRFQLLFRVRLVTTCAPALASIPLAYLGYGYWALVAASLAGSIANAAAIWRVTQWRPHWYWDTALARSMLGFGVWLMLESLVTWLLTWLDSLIVGAYLDTQHLGLFRTASNFTGIVFGVSLSAVLPVLYSSLSRLQQDDIAFRHFFSYCHRVVCMVAFPMAMTLYLFGDLVGFIVFGSTWQGIGWTLGMLGMLRGFSFLFTLNGEAYRAKGRPVYNTLVMLANLLVFLPTYMLAVQHGYEHFVVARVCVAFVQIPYHFFVSKRVFSYSFADAMWNTRWPILGVLAMLSTYYLLSDWMPARMSSQILLALVCAGVYGLFIIPERSVIRRTGVLLLSKPDAARVADKGLT